jgi:hypothetical protein
MYREKIVNVETGEETWRDYTDAEIAEIEAAQAEGLARAEAAAEREAARSAVLTKLGLTAEEAQALMS